MQNESELKKIFPKFKKNLNERISEATGTTREFEFLSWWCETAYEGYVTLDYTDASGDGKIDAVVQRPNGEWIVIQAKYNDGYSKTPPDVNRCPREQWEPFDLIAVPAFRNENKFEYYIKSQNIPREKRAIYEKVFHAYQKDSRKVVFEFVTTYDVPKNIEQVLTNIKPQNFCYINDIMSLFNLQQHHQSPPANDLVLTIEQDNVISKQDNDYKINSYLAEVNLKQIIKYMKDNFPDLLMASTQLYLELLRMGYYQWSLQYLLVLIVIIQRWVASYPSPLHPLSVGEFLSLFDRHEKPTTHYSCICLHLARALMNADSAATGSR
mgnify:CR=1 FL=1